MGISDHGKLRIKQSHISLIRDDDDVPNEMFLDPESKALPIEDLEFHMIAVYWRISIGDIEFTDAEESFDVELESVGEKNGYDIYSTPEEGRVAYKDGRLISAVSETVLDAIFNARFEGQGRFYNSGQEVQLLADSLGSAPWKGVTLSWDNSGVDLARGRRAKFNNGVAEVQRTTVNSDSENIDKSQRREFARSNFGVDNSSIDVNQDGHVIETTIEVKLSEYEFEFR